MIPIGRIWHLPVQKASDSNRNQYGTAQKSLKPPATTIPCFGVVGGRNCSANIIYFYLSTERACNDRFAGSPSLFVPAAVASLVCEKRPTQWREMPVKNRTKRIVSQQRKSNRGAEERTKNKCFTACHGEEWVKCFPLVFPLVGAAS